MRRFLLTLGITVCLVGPVQAEDSREVASETTLSCPYQPNYGEARVYTIDGYMADRFERYVNEGAATYWRIYPVQDVERFIVGGCTDDRFFRGLTRAISDRIIELGISERDLLKPLDSQSPFGVFGDFWNIAYQMYFLGYPELVTRAVQRLQDLKAENNTRAMIALAMLGGIEGNYSRPRSLKSELAMYESWFSDPIFMKRVADYPLFGITAKFTGFGAHDAEYVDTRYDALQKRLSDQVDENLAQAAALGDRVAMVHQVAGNATGYKPCDQDHENEWLNAPDWRTKFLSQPDPDATFKALRALVEEVITSDTTSANALGAAKDLAIGLANIASDCDYATENAGSFGIGTEAEAVELLQLAASAPLEVKASVAFGNEATLAIALGLDRGPGGSGKYHAAARFLVVGASGFADIYTDETFDIWVPRFSRATIREAQRILAEIDLYTAGIDGIAGPGFRKAIEELDCFVPGGTPPPPCFTGRAYELRAEPWARPYLTGPR